LVDITARVAEVVRSSVIITGTVRLGETIPVIEGKLRFSTWQNIFLCEFDGPRKSRNIVVTLIDSEK